MKENNLPENYLEKFPDSLKLCLNNESNMESFLNTIECKYDDLLVYRLVHSADKIDEYDFLGNREDYERNGKKRRIADKPSEHAVSVNEDLDEMLKSFSQFPNEIWKGIAKGYMKSIYGPADFIDDKKHHNWYLFKDANKIIYDEFELIKKEA